MILAASKSLRSLTTGSPQSQAPARNCSQPGRVPEGSAGPLATVWERYLLNPQAQPSSEAAARGCLGPKKPRTPREPSCLCISQQPAPPGPSATLPSALAVSPVPFVGSRLCHTHQTLPLGTCLSLSGIIIRRGCPLAGVKPGKRQTGVRPGPATPVAIRDFRGQRVREKHPNSQP